MFELLHDIWKPFTPKTEEEWKRLIQELGKATSGLGISPAERAQIVAAMGLPSGHWYTCPNGHVYAIGDCGGEAQRLLLLSCLRGCSEQDAARSDMNIILFCSL